MDWDILLNETRLRAGEERSPNDGRNAFDNDYTRLVFSSPFRRLQDKSQVFPLDNSDFVRTRLTHSVEVSAIGRSIGASVEKELIDKGLLKECHKGKISSLLAVIGLVHDLGNPPFGHFGETSVRTFFDQLFKSQSLSEEMALSLSKLTEEEKEDFLKFEGNAQCFRLLTKLQFLIKEPGHNLSLGTLAAIQKYPRSSKEGNQENTDDVSYKKSGYFQAEKDTFRKAVDGTGIGKFRHPIAFLLEASDDIAYSAADIEDGFKKNVLDFTTLKKVLKEHINIDDPEDSALLKSLETYESEVPESYPDPKEIVVQRFRIKAQGYMIRSVVDIFVKRHDEFLEGKFTKDILLESKAGNVRRALKELAKKHIFNDKNIITIELVGDEVIRGLLHLFVNAVLSEDRKKPGTTSHKLYQLISPNYRYICENYPYKIENNEPSVYDRLLLVTDFICGMTDSYAIELYRKLKGVKL